MTHAACLKPKDAACVQSHKEEMKKDSDEHNLQVQSVDLPNSSSTFFFVVFQDSEVRVSVWNAQLVKEEDAKESACSTVACGS